MATTFSPMYYEQPIVIVDTTEALSMTTGSLILYGGVTINSTYQSLNASSGSLVIAGGVGIEKNLNIGGRLTIESTVESNSVSSGALVIHGGLGIAKNIHIGQDTFIGGNLYVNGVTTSINTTTINVSDNTFMLNSGPTGSRDSGILIQRYQTDVDDGSGDVVGPNEPVAHSDTVITGGTDDIILQTSDDTLDISNWWIKIGNRVRQIVSFSVVNSGQFLVSLSSPFNTVVNTNDVYNLYNRNYVAQYYNEQDDEFVLGYISNASDIQIALGRTDLLKIRTKTVTSDNVYATNSTITNLVATNFTSAYASISDVTIGTLNVTGGSIFTSGITTDNLYVQYDSILNNTTTGSLSVIGDSVLNGYVTAGALNVTGDSVLTGNVTAGSLFVTGATLLTGVSTNTLFVASEVQFNGAIYINGVDTTPSPGDISREQLFVLQNDVSTPTSITSFAFSGNVVRAFEAQVTVNIVTSGTDKFAFYTLKGLQKDGTWVLSSSFIGDLTGITFSITSGGQVQYTSTNIPDYTSSHLTYRATTSSIMTPP
jgi:hypothetical protein